MLGVALEFKNLPDTTTPLNSTNLNNMQKLMVDLIYPVGIYIEISDSDFNPNTAWGGTWVLENDGTVLVSKSSSSSSKFNADINTIVGEEQHTLTVNEMPSHSHNANLSAGTETGISRLITSDWSWDTKNQQNGGLINLSGGGQPHNNVQPSKIANRWHRTA